MKPKEALYIYPNSAAYKTKQNKNSFWEPQSFWGKRENHRTNPRERKKKESLLERKRETDREGEERGGCVFWRSCQIGTRSVSEISHISCNCCWICNVGLDLYCYCCEFDPFFFFWCIALSVLCLLCIFSPTYHFLFFNGCFFCYMNVGLRNEVPFFLFSASLSVFLFLGIFFFFILLGTVVN